MSIMRITKSCISTDINELLMCFMPKRPKEPKTRRRLTYAAYGTRSDPAVRQRLVAGTAAQRLLRGRLFFSKTGVFSDFECRLIGLHYVPSCSIDL